MEIDSDSDRDPASACSTFGPQSLTSPTFMSLFSPFPLTSSPPTPPAPSHLPSAIEDIEDDISLPVLPPFASSLRSLSNPPSIRPDSATIDPLLLARPPSFPPSLSRTPTLRSTIGSFRRRRAATVGSTSSSHSSRAPPRSTHRHTPASSRDLSESRRRMRPNVQQESAAVPLPDLEDFRAWLESDSSVRPSGDEGENGESSGQGSSGPSTPPRMKGGAEVAEETQISPKSLYDDDGFLRF